VTSEDRDDRRIVIGASGGMLNLEWLTLIFALARVVDTRDWIVVEDRTLEDLDNSVEIRGFSDKNDAIRFAQARSNGNVDYRVLRVTDQVLVVGTYNEL